MWWFKTWYLFQYPKVLVLFCAGILERGITVDGFGSRCFTTYESNVLFALRFMIDCDIVGGNWIELPSGSYIKTSRNMSYCQLEVDVWYPWKEQNAYSFLGSIVQIHVCMYCRYVEVVFFVF